MIWRGKEWRIEEKQEEDSEQTDRETSMRRQVGLLVGSCHSTMVTLGSFLMPMSNNNMLLICFLMISSIPLVFLVSDCTFAAIHVVANMLNTVHSHNNGQTCCFHIQHWGWIWSQCLCPCIATVVYGFQIKIPLGNVLNSAFEISDALDRAALILLLLSALCQLILFVLTWMLIFCHWLWCWWLSYSPDSWFDSVQIIMMLLSSC